MIALGAGADSLRLAANPRNMFDPSQFGTNASLPEEREDLIAGAIARTGTSFGFYQQSGAINVQLIVVSHFRVRVKDLFDQVR